MPDYFTLAELRALPDLDDTGTYPDAACEAAAAHIVGIIEREVGTSFVARTVTNERHNGNNRCGLRLDNAFVLSVTSATIDGVAVAESLVQYAGVVERLSGSVPVPWYAGTVVLVTYQAGYTADLATVPADIKQAALQGTRAYLLETSELAAITDRRSQITNDAGGTTSFVMAGQDEDHPTGYPMVDSVIVGWRNKLDVMGFA